MKALGSLLIVILIPLLSLGQSSSPEASNSGHSTFQNSTQSPSQPTAEVATATSEESDPNFMGPPTPEWIKSKNAAQTPETSEKKPDLSERMGEVVDEVQKAHRDFTKHAETIRSEKKYFGALEWTPVDFLVPVKWGAHAGYNAGPNQSYELEYIRGSLSVPFLIDNLGSVVDDRFSLTARKFYGGTFNLFYGLDYLRFRINLGDEILSRIAVIAQPDVDVLQIASFGAHLGLGNRWSIGEHMTVGLDWFSWTQPFYTSYSKSPYLGYATNERDEDKVRGALKIVEYFPRLTFLRFSVGATF